MPDVKATERIQKNLTEREAEARRALSGLRLPLRRPGHCRGRAGHRHGHSAAGRPLAPGQGRRGLRQERLPASTGKPVRSAAPRAAPAPAGSGHPARPRRDRVDFARADCRACPSRTKCTTRPRHPHAHPAAPRTPRDAPPQPAPSRRPRPGRPSTPSAPGVEGTINQALGRHRHPPGPLPRPAESPSPTRLLRHRAQRGPARRLVDHRPTTQTPHQPHEFTSPGASVTASHLIEEGCFRPAMIQLL